MSYNVITTTNFRKEFKRLVKKYPGVKQDIIDLQLDENPLIGDALHKGCRKIRMAITGKPSGKSGGARVIVQVLISEREVYLLSIYDKSDTDTISEKWLDELISQKLD